MARERETRRPAKRSRPKARAAGAALRAEELLAAFAAGPSAAALVRGGRIVAANDALARALGTDPGTLRGRALSDLLPPLDPDPGAHADGPRSYRTLLGGVPARVDVASGAGPGRRGGRALWMAVLAPSQDSADLAADRALLALSRDLSEARSEDAIVAALSRALELLFPGRSFAVRLVDPATLALGTLYARGRLRSRVPARLALRRAAVERTGLSGDVLERGGGVVTEAGAPLVEDCETAVAVPLAAGGQLFGLVNLEYPSAAPGDREADAPLLYRLANHAALGVRIVRSIEELTRLKRYQEDLVERANALIFVVNRCRELVVWNAGLVALTGFEKEVALGDDLFSVVPADERAALEAVILHGFAGEPVSGFETRLLRKYGGEVRIALNTAAIVGEGGEVDGVVAIAQDMTRVRSLEAAAEHAERLAAVGRIVAGVVHELNNPLTAVNMYSDVLVEKLSRGRALDAGDVEKLRAVKEAGLRIQRLARDLVAYARPAGARTEPVNLRAVIEDAVRLATPALKERRAVLETLLDEVPEIEANRTSLVQVCVSLLSNAAQAIRDRGLVRVALAPGQGAVWLSVEDDGEGMAPDVAARAFEPFFTTRSGVGIGLGLPIVKGIVDRHGGAVSLASAVGRGTTVTVTLPVKRAAEASAAR